MHCRHRTLKNEGKGEEEKSKTYQGELRGKELEEEKQEGIAGKKGSQRKSPKRGENRNRQQR